MKTGATLGWAVTQQQCCRLLLRFVLVSIRRRNTQIIGKIQTLSQKYVSEFNFLIGCGAWAVLCNCGRGEVADVLWNAALHSSMELIICVCWQHTQRVSLFNKHLVHSREDVLMRLYTLTNADWASGAVTKHGEDHRRHFKLDDYQLSPRRLRVEPPKCWVYNRSPWNAMVRLFTFLCSKEVMSALLSMRCLTMCVSPKE